MPELPEVETVRLGLLPALKGRKLVRVTLRRKDLRKPFPAGFAQKLTGAGVLGIARRAKYLLIRLDNDLTLLTHLGMSGRMRFLEAKETPGPHDHVLLETDKGLRIVFCDPRRFGLMTLLATKKEADHPLLRDIGPEPLDAAFTGKALANILAGRKTAIKTALMDQRLIAGIGNIYASEALFRAKISPLRPAHRLTGPETSRLASAIRLVLKAAIKAGGSSLKDHARPDGKMGYFQHSFAVYDRSGQACPGCSCDLSRTGGIQRIVQGGRATFYCPHAQR